MTILLGSEYRIVIPGKKGDEGKNGIFNNPVFCIYYFGFTSTSNGHE